MTLLYFQVGDQKQQFDTILQIHAVSTLMPNASRHFDVMLTDQIQARACTEQTLPVITCEVTIFAR